MWAVHESLPSGGHAHLGAALWAVHTLTYQMLGLLADSATGTDAMLGHLALLFLWD